MKKIFFIAILVLGLFFTFSPKEVDARVSVRGYFRSSGSYVAPHYRTSPNRYKFDNWSSRGNYNPYTGRSGYRNWY